MFVLDFHFASSFTVKHQHMFVLWIKQCSWCDAPVMFDWNILCTLSLVQGPKLYTCMLSNEIKRLFTVEIFRMRV